MTAGAAATGAKVWLAARHFAWLTERSRLLLGRGIITAGIAAAALVGPSAI